MSLVSNTLSSVEKIIAHGQGGANLLALNYKNHLIEKGLSPSTINRRLSALRSVLRLARTLGIINWSLDIANQKSKAYRDTRGISVNKIQDLMIGLSLDRTPKSIRDLAIVRLLFDLGLRVSEVCKLDIEDLDIHNQRISILGKARTQKEFLSLAQPTIESLQEWLLIRPNLNTSAIFTNFDRSKKSVNKRITRYGIYKIIKKLGEENNIAIHPHSFRHSSVTMAVNEAQKNNINLREVLKFSRHSKLETLQVYVDSIENKQGELSSLVSKAIHLKKVD